MAKKYKHIFFDLDHTLWDFDQNSNATLKRLYDEYNLSERGIPDFVAFNAKYDVHNQKMWDKFRKGLIRREELRWKRFWLTLLDFKVPSDNLAYELSSAYIEILPTQTILIPHAKEVLEHCKGKYTLHLITNGYDMTQRMKLQYSGISSYFKEIITSEGSHSMKPHGAIFEHALASTGATIDDCIMIGDALDVDILGAYNAGWDQIYYNPSKTTHDRKPTYEVACLSELTEIL